MLAPYLRSLLFLGLGLASSAAPALAEVFPTAFEQSSRDSLPLNGAQLKELRPWRDFVLKLEPELDAQKPLAKANDAGWALASETLVGSIASTWIAGFDFPSLAPRWWLKAPGEATAPTEIFGHFAIMAFRDGSLWKIDTLKGEKIWSVQLSTFANRQFVKVGNTLLAITADQSLYAIDFQSGKALWVHNADLQDGIKLKNNAPPSVFQKTIYYGQYNGDILAIDLDTGELRWSHNPGYCSARFCDVLGELALVDQFLVLTRADGLIAPVSLADPKQKVTAWSAALNTSAIATSTFRHGRLYVGYQNGVVKAYNLRNGKELWTSEVSPGITQLTAGDTSLFVVAEDGKLAALDVIDGRVQWLDKVAGIIAARPFYWNQNIIFATGQQVLYGYRTAQQQLETNSSAPKP